MNLYYETGHLNIVNIEDFRTDILSESLDLQTLKNKLENVHWIGHSDRLTLSPSSDEEELINRFEILRYLKENRVSIPEFNLEDFKYGVGNWGLVSRYIRDRMLVGPYCTAKSVAKALKKGKVSKSPRLEHFRSELERAQEVYELEKEIRDYVREVTKSTAHYVGSFNVRIHAVQEKIGLRDEGVKTSLQVEGYVSDMIGISNVSKMVSAPTYSPTISDKILRLFIGDDNYFSLINKKGKELERLFYEEKIEEPSYGFKKSVSEVLTSHIRHLIHHNKGKTSRRASTYKIRSINNLLSEGKISREKAKSVLEESAVEVGVPLFASSRSTHPYIQDMNTIVYEEHTRLMRLRNSQGISMSLVFSITPEGIALKLKGFLPKTKSAKTINNKRIYNQTAGRSVDIFTAHLNEYLIQVSGLDKEESEIASFFNESDDHLGDGCVFFKSSSLKGEDMVHRLPNLYEQDEIKEKVEEVIRWRYYIATNLCQLKCYEIIKDHFNNSKFRSQRLTIPVVSRNKSLKFKNLVPIHLLGEKNKVTGRALRYKEIRPISNLDSYGCNLVVLTGQNAGGKSSALEAIVNAFYLAHCGLPVNADYFEFNARETIGLCFLSRGQGSTMQMQSFKIKNMLQAFRDVEDPDKCLAIIDELGTGTTQDSIYTPAGGFGFSAKILSAFSAYDTIISTQITMLAEMADESMNAACYMFDDNHKVSPGIGKPDLNPLIKQTGLDEFIS